MGLWYVLKGDNLHGFVKQMSGLVRNINIGIYSDTINCDECQTVHNGTTHGGLAVHTTFTDPDHISWSQQCWAVLTENFVFLSS